jgi:hypothetical protein
VIKQRSAGHQTNQRRKAVTQSEREDDLRLPETTRLQRAQPERRPKTVEAQNKSQDD